MKTSRTKYSKANLIFSHFVNNIEIMKNKKIAYNNIKEKQLKYRILAQANNKKEYSVENIFIETDELYDFLSSTQIKCQSDIAQQVYYSLKNRKYNDFFSDNPRPGIPYRFYVFRLFAPINKIPTSLAVCISCTPTFEEGFDLNFINFNDATGFQELILHKEAIHALENDYIRINNYISQSKYSKKVYEYCRVIMNLLFYMNAYPENVIKGPPQRAVMDENTSISKNKITISKNLELFKSHETSPHLRSGHWRTFTSDFFTNKKGETIWIDTMYIKGEALTVIEGNNE